jgi:hypothetical protein
MAETVLGHLWRCESPGGSFHSPAGPRLLGRASHAGTVMGVPPGETEKAEKEVGCGKVTLALRRYQSSLV